MNRMKLFGWLAFSALVVVMAAAVLLPGSKQPLAKPAMASAPSDRLELEALLGEMKRAWQPWAKARLLSKAAAKIDRFKDPLLNLLQEPEPHPLHLQAIQLAADLELTQCREAIAHLAINGKQSVRPQAILAADRLGSWSRSQLLDFLREPRPTVVCAALKLCSTRANRPLAEILLLLSHEDLDVRQAAIQAVPRDLTPDQLKSLLSVARSATDDQLLPVIQAIGRTTRVKEVEDFLLEQLDSREQVVRLAVLDTLTAHAGKPLHHPTTVWEFALNTDFDLTERAKAFVCLERTGSFDTALIRAELPRLHPYLTYFAARCLVRAGDKQGIRTLIELVETPRTRFGLDAPRVDAVLYAARRLLTDLSKIPPQSDPEAWRQWCQNLTKVRPRQLGSPPLNLRPASIGTASSPR